jgi:uncharacterized membrane protein YeaQ/YmgE (transglycosylase-associated protein family)
MTGVVFGLLIRYGMNGRAYGTVADVLFGITGAFAGLWLVETMGPSDTSWYYRLLSAMLGAAVLPALAHIFHRRPLFRRALDPSSPVNRILSTHGLPTHGLPTHGLPTHDLPTRERRP